MQLREKNHRKASVNTHGPGRFVVLCPGLQAVRQRDGQCEAQETRRPPARPSLLLNPWGISELGHQIWLSTARVKTTSSFWFILVKRMLACGGEHRAHRSFSAL